jgi:uncharacterized membrane protein
MNSAILGMAKQFVMVTKLHPILVNFTAALVPVSVGSDGAACLLKNLPLRHVAWWSLVYAVVVTPLTALSGWLFWMKDDTDSTGMAIHKWLGTAMVFLLAGLFLWRRRFEERAQWVSVPYLLLGGVLVVMLAVQGHLGGVQVFSGMD